MGYKLNNRENPLSTITFAEMELIDTHIHLYAEEYSSDRTALIEGAIEAGVKKFLLPNIDHTSLDGLAELVENYPENCFPMMGLHPCYVKENYLQDLKQIESLLRGSKYYAIGEIGMDKYWELDFLVQQEEALRQQLRWADELNLPVALHTRNATDEVIALIKSEQLKNLRGVFHCFSGDLKQAEEVVALGFHLGIGGVLTFKNSGLDKIVEQIPMEYLLLETDGPYLAPAPHRGKRNEPAYLRLVAERLAVIKNCSVEEVAQQTSANAKKLFGI